VRVTRERKERTGEGGGEGGREQFKKRRGDGRAFVWMRGALRNGADGLMRGRDEGRARASQASAQVASAHE
jgi:hypothetical protein